MSEELRENLFKEFDPETRIIIDVVFPGEYRIGFEFKGIRYIPGMASYYPLARAVRECLEFYRQLVKFEKVVTNG
jgi:hypothetical protein